MNLLAQDGNSFGALPESPTRKTSQKKGRSGKVSLWIPVPQDNVIDWVEMMNRGGVSAEIKADDPGIARFRAKVRFNFIQKPGKYDGQQFGIVEYAGGVVCEAMRAAVLCNGIAGDSQKYVVFIHQPRDEIARRINLPRTFLAVAQLAGDGSRQRQHGLKIFNCQENTLQDGEDFMLHSAELFF